MARYKTEAEIRAQKKAVRNYDEKHVRFVSFKFNLRTDEKLLEWLDSQTNKQGYIKKLIWDDMRAHGIEPEER